MTVNPWEIIEVQRGKISDLLLQNKVLRDRITGYESGQKYVQMKKRMRDLITHYERQIKALKAEAADARIEREKVREMWFQACEDVIKESERKEEKAQKEAAHAKEKQYEAERQRDAALERAREKNAEMYAAKVALEEEREKNQALTARINKDHTNSSKPSSANPNHKTIPNSRVKSGLKPGAQKGHTYHPRKMLTPTEILTIPVPEEYVNDPDFYPTGKMIHKQSIGIHVVLDVKEYATAEYRNRVTGQRVHAAFPAGMKDEVTYDGTVKSMAYLLNNHCNVSIDKTRRFLFDITGNMLNLSNGTICNLAREFSKKTQDERDQIFLDLLAAPILHTDFTFGRVNGKTSAVIICTTPDGKVLFQARKAKGKEGVKESPVEFYEGTVVSDHESVLADKGKRHQECMAHIQRYVRSAEQNEPDRLWPPILLCWIQDAFHFWNQRNLGKEVPDGKPDELISQLRKILESANDEYLKIPPPSYFPDGFNTIKRMRDKLEDYTLFLTDPTVPPTNNIAERCGRKFKRKAHQVISFRSFHGSEYFCDGLSIIEGLRARNLNLFDEVADRFSSRR